MLAPSWSTKLSQQPLYATISSIPQPSIVFQGTYIQKKGISNQLIAYTSNQSIPLPIRKQILYLSSLPTNELLLLTRYELTCFDLNNNDEVFVKEFENAQKLYVSNNYIYVISGSDVSCFTHGGEEQYVNHLGNNVTEIEACQLGNGEELVVSMEDVSMKRFKGVNVTFDYAKVVGLVNCMCWVDGGVLVGTEEGTIAYYESKKSKWKAKSTHPTFKIINWIKDGKDNVLVARKNGTIELRDHKKGETISKLKVGEPMISFFLSDFRTKGQCQLLCICKSSTVKAFNLQDQEVKIEAKNLIGVEQEDEIKKVDQLVKEKVQLEFEISQLQEILNKEDTEDGNCLSGESPLNPDFAINAQMKYDKGMTLEITCKNGFISGLSFQQPIMPCTVERTEFVSYTFQKQNKIAGQILCQALCHSSFSSKSYQIRAFNIMLSKFWHWGYTTQKRKQIEGCIKFNLVQRNARYMKWMQECFFMNLNEEEMTKLQGMPVMSLRFYNFYDDQEMEFIFKSKEGKVEIRCDSIEIIGQIVQDLMEYVGAKELDSTLTFPPMEKERLKSTLETIERLSQTKISINSQMAEAVNNIKFLLVKGQSSIAVGSLNDLRKSYGQIMNQNKNIMLEIQKKNLNTASLSDAMKVLGKFINQTAGVRFGKVKEEIITHCRQAIKKKDFPKIVAIMEQGKSAIPV